MRIVFGVKHFRLKTYTLEELNITDKVLPPGLSIVRLQKYFHLYWIPFFPVGQEWGMMKDNLYFDVPYEIETILDSREIKHKIPFYSFALPILVVAGFLFFWLQAKVENYRYSLSRKEEVIENHAKLLELLSPPKLRDYYDINATGLGKLSSMSKVVGVTSDSVILQMQTYDSQKRMYYSTLVLEDCFTKEPDSTELATVAISDLKKCIPTIDNYKYFSGYEMKVGEENNTCILRGIVRSTGPVFRNAGKSILSKGKIELMISNIGEMVTITELNYTYGNVNWITELPFEVKADEDFVMRGTYSEEPFYSIQITCKNLEGELFKYFLKGKNTDFSLNR